MHGPAKKTAISTARRLEVTATKTKAGKDTKREVQKTGLRPIKSPMRGTMRTPRNMPTIQLIAILAIALFGLQTRPNLVYKLYMFSSEPA